MVYGCTEKGVSDWLLVFYVVTVGLPVLAVVITAVIFVSKVYPQEKKKDLNRQTGGLLSMSAAILILSALTGPFRLINGPLIYLKHTTLAHIVLIISNASLGVILSLTLGFATLRIEQSFADSIYALTDAETKLLRTLAVIASLAVFGCAVMLSFVRPDPLIIGLMAVFAAVAVLTGLPHAVLVQLYFFRRLQTLIVSDSVTKYREGTVDPSMSTLMHGLSHTKSVMSADKHSKKAGQSKAEPSHDNHGMTSQSVSLPRKNTFDNTQRKILKIASKSTVLSIFHNISYIISAAGALASMFRRCLDIFASVGDCLFWLGLMLFCVQTLLSFTNSNVFYHSFCKLCDSYVIRMVVKLTDQEIDHILDMDTEVNTQMNMSVNPSIAGSMDQSRTATNFDSKEDTARQLPPMTDLQ